MTKRNTTNNTREVVCVTGASGCVGQSLLPQLLSKGYRVKALFRKDDTTTRLWKQRGCEIVLGDLDDDTALAYLTTDVTKVFHCAAIMAKKRYYFSYHVNVERTIALYKAAAKNHCRVFVFVSSISVYCGTTVANNIFTEAIPPQQVKKLNSYSRSKLEMEQAFDPLFQRYKLPFLIIRPTNIYGPHSLPWVIRMLDVFAKIPVAFGNISLNIVYVDDVTRALIQAAESPNAYNQTFNISGEEILLSDYITQLCKITGITLHKLPAGIDFTVRFLVDRIQYMRSPVIPSFTFSRPRYYPSTHALHTFSYTPAVSLHTGLRKTGYWLHSRTSPPVFSRTNLYLSRLKKFHPLEVRRVKQEQDILEAVQLANAERIAIRAFGAMGSKNSSFHTAGIGLDLSDYNKVLHFRGNQLTVQAGITIRELIAFLTLHHRALPTIGEWDEQTIAGALSTATHGGSHQYGTLASSVQALRLILPDGSVKTYTKTDKEFAALLVSFGIYGIISEVTLRTVPAFNLALTTFQTSFQEFLKQIDQYNSTHDYFNALWFPPIKTVLVYYADKTKKPVTITKREQRYTPQKLFLSFASVKLRRNLLVYRHSTPRTMIGTWDTILCPITKRHTLISSVMNFLKIPLAMEVAIPRHNAVSILNELEALFQQYSSSLVYPFGLRYTKAEEAYLSPSYDRDTFWIDIFIKNHEELFQSIVQIVQKYHARFHWGKSIPVDGEYLSAQYPQWKTIVRLKQEIDPKQICSNTFSTWFGL